MDYPTTKHEEEKPMKKIMALLLSLLMILGMTAMAESAAPTALTASIHL